MLVLREAIEIHTSPERVFDWFQHLDDNYCSWYPDHVSCRYLRGHGLQNGAVLCAEEYIHGRLHRLKFKLMQVEAGRGFKYRILPGVGGGFRMRSSGLGTEFVAEIFLGSSFPILGGLVDVIVRAFFSDHIKAIRQHMREESVNLRALLAGGSFGTQGEVR